jgi:hypothetical protein
MTTTATELPILLLLAPCFDRRSPRPLPVQNRWHYLDCSQLPADQSTEIVSILRAKDAEKPHFEPKGFGQVLITMSVGPSSPGQLEMMEDQFLRKYRKYFLPVPDNDARKFTEHPERCHRKFRHVKFACEHFEDENGTPVTQYEMLQHVTGREFPIIMGEPRSILRLGPTSATNKENWTVAKANAIAQFLDVMDRLFASKWLRAPKSITSMSGKNEGSELLEAIFPNDTDTIAVLAYFRQLHAKDRLFVRACDAYLEHSGDQGKRVWMEERRTTFVQMVDMPPSPFSDTDKTRREIFRMFVYGARILHSSPDRTDDVALKEFLSKHGRHGALMIFNSCLMDLYRVAASVYPVIRQDYQHWITKDGVAAADRVSIPDLFAEFNSPPQQ